MTRERSLTARESALHLPGPDGHAEARADADAAHAAREAARRLTLLRGVLEDDAGRAMRSFLEALRHADADAATETYSRLYRLLAEEAELGDGLIIEDAWQSHLVRRLLSDVNALSRKAELAGAAAVSPALLEAARHDLRCLQVLFRFDAAAAAAALAAVTGHRGWPEWRGFAPLRATATQPVTLATRLAEAPDWGELAEALAEHYAAAGAGIFAQYRAFRWVRRGPDDGRLVGVSPFDPIRLDQLIGYETERRLIIKNTEHFLAGLPANNVLLYGDRGTGKSSTVKALLNEYGDRGLRLIEVPKQALADYPKIIALLRGRRERFILFVDDLSFSEQETYYKDLKAILEGSLEARPENVLVYATSNRRHLVTERFSDRETDPNAEVRIMDTVQEKLSLSDRFGLTVVFQAPDQERYLEIVEGLARQLGLEIALDELRRRALQWAAWHNGRSGRTARQFIDFLAAELALARQGRS
jgi:predicted AAA+ superfamily ATPase